MVTSFSAIPGCNGARDTALQTINAGPRGFMIKELVRGDRHRKYGLFVPAAYNPNGSTKFPVIIFLHGLGEGGSDSHANLRVGLAPFVADQASTFNFICIFPQSDSGSWDENSENATDVIACLDEVTKQYPVDTDRVSLTGLSTGGYGTWAIGAKYKERFAALVPMGSSAADFKDAERLVDMPIRCYHNNGDMFAAMWNDDVMVNKIKTLGGKAEMFKTDGPGHDCWEIAYGETDMFSWLAQQSRAARGAAPRRSSSAARESAPVMPVSHTPATPIYETQVRETGSAAVVPTPY
jgi:predicted peptidase